VRGAGGWNAGQAWGETPGWGSESPGVIDVQAEPGAGGRAVLARCQPIIAISLPRLDRQVIKSGSVLPWDFFFFPGRNRRLKKPQNLIR